MDHIYYPTAHDAIEARSAAEQLLADAIDGRRELSADDLRTINRHLSTVFNALCQRRSDLHLLSTICRQLGEADGDRVAVLTDALALAEGDRAGKNLPRDLELVDMGVTDIIRDAERIDDQLTRAQYAGHDVDRDQLRRDLDHLPSGESIVGHLDDELDHATA